MKKLLLPLLLAAVAASAAAADTYNIAVIPKGTTHEFWKAVHAGAVKASKELGVEIIWKGPLKEDDLKSQIDLVQSFTAQGVSGIVLAPLNDVALGSSVKGAVRAKTHTRKHVARGLLMERERPRRCRRGRLGINPAASYSPTRLPVQYHWLREA